MSEDSLAKIIGISLGIAMVFVGIIVVIAIIIWSFNIVF